MADNDDEDTRGPRGSCILIDVTLPEGKTFTQPPMRHPLDRRRIRVLKGKLVRKKPKRHD